MGLKHGESVLFSQKNLKNFVLRSIKRGHHTRWDSFPFPGWRHKWLMKDEQRNVRYWFKIAFTWKERWDTETENGKGDMRADSSSNQIFEYIFIFLEYERNRDDYFEDIGKREVQKDLTNVWEERILSLPQRIIWQDWLS